VSTETIIHIAVLGLVTFTGFLVRNKINYMDQTLRDLVKAVQATATKSELTNMGNRLVHNHEQLRSSHEALKTELAVLKATTK
jgi:hypothetical protein